MKSASLVIVLMLLSGFLVTCGTGPANSSPFLIVSATPLSNLPVTGTPMTQPPPTQAVVTAVISATSIVSPTEAGSPTQTVETACPLPAPEMPGTINFAPIQIQDAIAFSNSGLVLFFPETGLTVTVHSLSGPKLDRGDRGFAWSPSATQIAFLYTNPCGRGYLMLADFSLGNIRALVDKPGLYSRPAWSLDGQQLVFTEESGQLIALQVKTGSPLVISTDAASGSPVTWIDNNTIAYLRHNASGTANLVSRKLAGSAPSILITDTVGINEDFDFSPDRTRLAYHDGAPWVVGLTGVSRKKLGSDPSQLLQWSPNGQFLLGRGGLSAVFLAQPDLSDTVIQLDLYAVPGAHAWAPDSKRFVVMLGADGSKNTTLGVYDISRKNLERLSIAIQFPNDMVWSTR